MQDCLSIPYKMRRSYRIKGGAAFSGCALVFGGIGAGYFESLNTSRVSHYPDGVVWAFCVICVGFALLALFEPFVRKGHLSEIKLEGDRMIVPKRLLPLKTVSIPYSKITELHTRTRFGKTLTISSENTARTQILQGCLPEGMELSDLKGLIEARLAP